MKRSTSNQSRTKINRLPSFKTISKDSTFPENVAPVRSNRTDSPPTAKHIQGEESSGGGETSTTDPVVSSENAANGSNLYDERILSDAMGLFHFLRISNPSDDDIIFVLALRAFGLDKAIHFSIKHEWQVDRVLSVLNKGLPLK